MLTPGFTGQTSAHYLVVLGFLRSAVSPPPDKWFARFESWRAAGDALIVTVPHDATRAVLFLVPEKRGDFATIRSAVQGQPGAFLRAAHNLALASLDQQRLNVYLDELGQLAAGGGDDVARTAATLAANLQLKLDDDCLAKPRDEQVACLGEKGEELVLDDGHGSTLAEAIAGPGADLAQQVTASSVGGLGSFNPYVGLIREIAGLFSSIHTPKFQYIPALTLADGAGLHLLLNRAPSFHSPRSVIMVALPAIESPTDVPGINPLPGQAATCVEASNSRLPVTLNPLFYATGFAHDMTVTTRLSNGREIAFPLTPDVRRGGLAIHTPPDLVADLPTTFSGTITGRWGFGAFSGPSIELQSARVWQWRAEVSANAVTLLGDAPACVTSISLSGRSIHPTTLKWRSDRHGALEADLPSDLDRDSGPVKITIAGPSGTPSRTLDVTIPKPGDPQLRLIAIDVERSRSQDHNLTINLASHQWIDSEALVRLSVGTDRKHHFTAGSKVEFEAGLDGTDKLLAATDAVTLLDPSSAIISFEPARLLGSGAFGRLRMRTRLDGRDSAWLDIGTLVRTPRLTSLSCPPAVSQPCQLNGEQLYLLDAVSGDPAFSAATRVAFATLATSLMVSRPTADRLFLRLHDAPDADAAVDLPARTSDAGKE